MTMSVSSRVQQVRVHDHVSGQGILLQLVRSGGVVVVELLVLWLLQSAQSGRGDGDSG